MMRTAMLLTCAAILPAQDAPRPNVILILADDLGAECLGSYGGTSHATPELDRLAANGLRFTDCHTQPLCTPTRLELLTGLSNARNYVAFSVLPPGSRTVAHVLRDAGYATGAFGKWQLFAADHYPAGVRGTGTLPEDAGFDTHCLWQVDGLGSRYWGPTLRVDGETRTYPDEVYGPDLFAEHLLRFVETARDRPFFAFWPMALTHDPFVPPPPRADDLRGRPRHFGAMVAYMDGLVGRVVRRVEELGLAERTLVVFVGDNGTGRRIRSQRGDEAIQGGKGTTTDAGTHVPLIVWGAGVASAPRTSDALVCTRDLLPTLAELAGVALDGPVDGRSLVPDLRGGEVPERDALAFWYHPRPRTRPESEPIVFALDSRFRLYADGRMFDRRADPDEQMPLGPDAHAEARARLSAALTDAPARRR